MATIASQSQQCVDYARHLTAAYESAQLEKKMLQELLNSQLVNNEEIFQAAREGKIERAKKIREKAIKRREDALGIMEAGK